MACTLAAERDALVTALAAIEVPLGLPLETPDRVAEAAARDAVHAAHAVAASFGVPVEGVVLHARDAGEAIVAETTLRDAEIVLIAEPAHADRGGGQLSRTTRYVLKHAPSRVMLIRGTAEIANGNGNGPGLEPEPLFRSGRPSDYWPTGEFVDRV